MYKRTYIFTIFIYFGFGGVWDEVGAGGFMPPHMSRDNIKKFILF